MNSDRKFEGTTNDSEEDLDESGVHDRSVLQLLPGWGDGRDGGPEQVTISSVGSPQRASKVHMLSASFEKYEWLLLFAEVMPRATP